MDTVVLRDLCIIEYEKKDDNGFSYTQYDLASEDSNKRFKVITGNNSGKIFDNLEQLTSDKYFEQSIMVGSFLLGAHKRYLQDIIKKALISEAKYFASDNVYNVKEVKSIMKQFNERLYLSAKKEHQDYTQEM